MGRLTHLPDTKTENVIGVFDYKKSVFNGDKYLDPDRKKPDRWLGKQPEAGQIAHRGKYSSAQVCSVQHARARGGGGCDRWACRPTRS